MSETEGQEEPTMEEILASIRKIISEDDEDSGEKAAEPEEAAAEPEPEVVEEVEPEPEEITLEDEPEEEDVLELTEMVDEEPEPAPEPEAVIQLGNDMGIDDVDPAIGDAILMSDGPSNDAMDQFGMLSELLTSGYEGSGNTLEDLVRQMLKPMLQAWLDKNLPPLVERMVAKEIARLARTKNLKG